MGSLNSIKLFSINSDKENPENKISEFIRFKYIFKQFFNDAFVSKSLDWIQLF